MSPAKIAAIFLVLAGILGLAYGKFSYTHESGHASIGSLEFSVHDKRTVNVPVWAGLGAVLAGAVLFACAGRKY